jgi:hypothetical protein
MANAREQQNSLRIEQIYSNGMKQRNGYKAFYPLR